MKGPLTLEQIEYMLHYAYSGEDSPRLEHREEVFDALTDMGLLVKRTPSRDDTRRFTLTDKGNVYVEAIRATQLPIKETRWVMPKPSAH